MTLLEVELFQFHNYIVRIPPLIVDVVSESFAHLNKVSRPTLVIKLIHRLIEFYKTVKL